MPRLDILPPAQRRLWPALRPASGLGFVLYGGTAIALRLGHRQSVDFDFFCDQPLDRDRIQSAFPVLGQATLLQDRRDTLSVLIPDGDSDHSHVKLSFFENIGIGRVGEPDFTDDGVLQVASLEDLMATKVKVVLQRAEAKDYRDILAMVRAGVSLAAGLAAAREMFGSNFQASEALKALVYFGDGDLHALTSDERTALVAAVRAVRELPDAVISSLPLAATKS